MATPKILLVDDTKLFLRLEQEYLRQSSVTVFTASNGREALETARKIMPDLIYMDLNMPEMNGIECCSAIKADPRPRRRNSGWTANCGISPEAEYTIP